MAAPTLQGSSAIAAATAGSSVTPVLPSHQTDDVIVVLAWIRATTGGLATPSGYSVGDVGVRGAVARYAWFLKYAVSGAEPNPTVAVSGGASADKYAQAHIIRGCAPGSPFEVSQLTSGTVDPAVLTGITTLGIDRLIALLFGDEDNLDTQMIVTATSPASLGTSTATSNRFVVSATGSDGGTGIAAASKAAAGATGNVSADLNGASRPGWGGFVVAFKPPIPVYEQKAYRFRNDDGSESSATWKAAQDTAVTLAGGDSFRLRYLIQNDGDLGSASHDFGLQVRKNGGAWSFIDGTGGGANAVMLRLSSGFADGDATTEQMAGAGTFEAGVIREANNTGIGSPPALDPTNETEFEWSLELEAANVTGGDTVELRLARQDGSLLDTYTATASITVGGGSTPIAGSDSGSGSDTSSLSASLPGADAQGSTIETTTRNANIPATDVQGSTIEVGNPVVAAAASDTSGGATESAVVDVKLDKIGTDVSGGATESAAYSQLIAAADASGVASEIAALLAAVSGSDLSGVLSEATALAVSISGADANAVVVETGSLATRIAGADVGASLELASLIATLAAADQLGTTQEATNLRYFVLGTDVAGATTEQVAITFAILGADVSGGSTETALITAISHAVSDVGSGSDNAVITGMTVFLTVSDSGVGSDLATILAQRAAADVGTSIDTAISVVSQAGSDSSGSILEQAILVANILVADLGATLDSGVLKVIVSGQDVGTGAEDTKVGHYGSDVGASTDSASTTASLVAFDQISTITEIASLVAFLAAQDESGEALELARAVLQGMLPAIRTGQIARVEGGRVASTGQPGSLSESSTGKVRSR